MTTLDQVHLLEEKVERAVAKLQQLQAENDALRKKCAELTNALSSKTEQLSSFTSDKDEIQVGIKKALDRLDFIENSVLKAGATVNPNGQTSIQITPGVSKINEAELNKVQKINVNNAAPQVNHQITKSSFDTMEQAPTSPQESQQVKPQVQNNFSASQFNMEPEFDLLGDDIPEEEQDFMSEPFDFGQIEQQAAPEQTPPTAPVMEQKKPDIF